MITGLPTFSDGEIPTHTKLNLLASVLTGKFAGGITGADIKYPLKLAGDIDLSGNDVINIGTSLGGARFADDFASIQAAINDLPATGGVVFLSNKTYFATTTIDLSGADGTVRSNVLLMGSGQSSVVKQSGANPVLRLGATKNQISNLTVDMNSSVTGVGIETNSVSYGRVSRVRIYNGGVGSTCIDLKNDENARVSDCVLLSGYGVRLQQTTGEFGPYYISGNSIQSSTGIYLDSPDAAYVTNNTIVATGIGIYAKVRPQTFDSGLVINRNMVSGSSSNACIYVDAEGAPFLMINGNVLSDGQYGIDLVSSTSPEGTRGVSIVGNVFIDLYARGIRCTQGGGAVLGLNILNNTFSNCTRTGGTQYVIELNGPSAVWRVGSSIIASNSFIKATPAPTYFISIGANCENILIAHNVGDLAATNGILKDALALNIVDQSNLWQA